jgi:hypothetical protein
MRQKLSLGLVAVVAALALTGIAASAASAAFGTFTNLEFIKAGTNNKFTGTLSGAAPKLTAAGSTVTCKTETSSGENGGNKTMNVLNVVVTFKGCLGGNGEEVHSKGAAAETIITNKLTGILGETETTTEATTKVALELEGPSGEFVTLEGPGLPISPAKITGQLAGEVTPINVSQTTGKNVFSVVSGNQAIKSVCLLTFKASATCGSPAKLDKPKLTAFGVATATQATIEAVTFGEATEVKAA